MNAFLRGPKIVLLSLLSAAALAASPAETEQEYGDAWADLGNFQRAVDHYRKAVLLDSKSTAARLSLANGLYRLGDKAAALEELASLEKLAPGLAAVPSAAGVIQLDLGRPDLACQCFDRALRLEPTHERSLFGKGQCLLASYQQAATEPGQAEAQQAFERYLASYPQGSAALACRDALELLRYGAAARQLTDARDALAKGKFRLAESLLREVLKQRPDLAQAHYYLGLALASPVLNQIDLARQEFTAAGNVKEALLQRAIYAFEDDDLEEAADLLQEALRQDPGYADAHYHLGLVCLEQGKGPDARKAFSRVTELSPATALAERASTKLQVMSGDIQFLREGEVIDAATEVALGRTVSQALESQFGLVQNPKLQERLGAILRKLTASADRAAAALPYRVKILNVEGVNALSFIGGTIYLFKGLTDFVRVNMDDADDAYAAILGHELVHIVLRHGLGMLNLVGGSRTLTQGTALDVRSIEKLMTGVSRINEYEADQLGCLYAYRAGFDPAAAYRFHRLIISQGKEVPDGLDHPTHTDRADHMKEYLLGLRTKARSFDAGLKALDASDYEQAIIHLEIFLGLVPGSPAGRNNLGVAMHRLALAIGGAPQGYKLTTSIDPRVQIKPIRVRGAKPEGTTFDRALMVEAAELFRSLARSEPDYLPARQNLAASLLALGLTAEARALFEQATQQGQHAPEHLVNLAVADLQASNLEPGIRQLQDVIAKHPMFADAHFNLALALQRTGKPDQARKAWLRYLTLDPSTGWAEAARQHLAELK